MKTNAFAFWCFVRVTSRVAVVAVLLLLTLRQLSGAIFTSSMLGDMLNTVFAENFGITTTPNLSCIVDIGSVEVGAFVHLTGLRDAGTQRDLSSPPRPVGCTPSKAMMLWAAILGMSFRGPASSAAGGT